jgi:hypothetical protein
MAATAFYTVHRPGEHSAHRLSGECLVQPQATEIGLVRKLGRLGIDLRRFDYFNNRGDEKLLVVNWRESL